VAEGAQTASDAAVRRSGLSRLTVQILVMPIRLYQTWISPMSAPTCRYYPSCSRYAVDALTVHGAVKGLLLGAWRLCRCHPWTPGGVDMVPPRGSWRSIPVDRVEEEASSNPSSTQDHLHTPSPIHVPGNTHVTDIRSAE
jgi:putative membrane protein insertion efficiency factor